MEVKFFAESSNIAASPISLTCLRLHPQGFISELCGEEHQRILAFANPCWCRSGFPEWSGLLRGLNEIDILGGVEHSSMRSRARHRRYTSRAKCCCVRGDYIERHFPFPRNHRPVLVGYDFDRSHDLAASPDQLAQLPAISQIINTESRPHH